MQVNCPAPQPVMAVQAEHWRSALALHAVLSYVPAGHKLVLLEHATQAPPLK